MNNKDTIMEASGSISMFCRLMLNSKSNLPIRSSEMGLLILLRESKRPITPLNAAHFFKVSKPMIASMVRTLDKKGYLTKLPSPDDKRSYYLDITDNGKTLVADALDDYTKTLQVLISKMGQEKFDVMIQLMKEANTYLGENQWEK